MKIEYHDWPSIADQTIVYGFRSTVGRTTVLEKAIVGEVHEHIVKATQRNWGNQAECYRTKRDGTLFKKSSCRWANDFYLDKNEAEDARKKALHKLKENLQEKIEFCQKRLDSL